MQPEPLSKRFFLFERKEIKMDKIKNSVCQKCGNSISQQQLPDGSAYYCCCYCGFTSMSALVIVDILEKFNSRAERGGSYVE